MNLIYKQKKALEKQYFRVWNIIELLSKKVPGDWRQIGIFLGHINIASDIKIYQEDEYFRINPINIKEDNNPIEQIIFILMDINLWVSEDEKEKLKSQVWEIASSLYWLKKDIFNFEPIMDLKIIEYPEKNEELESELFETAQIISQYQQDNNYVNPVLRNYIDSEFNQNQYDDLIKENIQLKEEIKLLKKKIVDIETGIIDLNKHDSNQKIDLIELIYDELDIDRYAPDLALAIKLWESIYIHDPKKDSHSNKADQWLSKNSGYEKMSISRNRIKEITTPFSSWGGQRSKDYKKK